MSLARLMAVSVCAWCLLGCRSDQPAGTLSDRGHAPGAGLAPPSDYRKELLRQAMRGLRYESGRVEIDEAVADTIVHRGTRAEAMAEYERGEAFLQQNQRIQAIGAFTRAVLIDPDEALLYEGLGTALLTKQKTHEALAAYRTALDRDPLLTTARLHLADALQRLGQHAEAANELREVIRREPDNGPARSRLAIVLYYVGDDTGAWEQVHAAEALGQPVPPQFRALLAQRAPEPAGKP